MTVKDGIKLGFGFTIGSALSGVIAKVILERIGATESKETED